tara:strand:- start:11252 stop:12076 length:825 start_codon:yes stop_codon:yes gene_type:complete
MSNLHKNLNNAELHDPKDFSTASNNTYLTKDGSGNLVWAADSGAGVSSIIAGTNVTISPAGGTGAVTINASGGGGAVSSLTTTGTSGASTLAGGVLNIPVYANTNTFQINYEAYGSIATGTEWGISNAQFNSEHKFTINLGSPLITTVTPKNHVSASVFCNTTSGTQLRSWAGWIWGGAGATVTLSLLRAKLACPIEGEYPSTIPVCRTATTTIALTGNSSPKCWNLSGDEITLCEGWSASMEANEMILATAYLSEGEEGSFVMNNNLQFTSGI